MNDYSHSPAGGDDAPTLHRKKILAANDSDVLEATLPRLQAQALTLPQSVDDEEMLAMPSPPMSERVGKNILVQGVGKIFGYVSTLLGLALSISIFSKGTDFYGNYATIMIYLAVFSVIADGGIMSISVREAAHYPDKIEKIISTTFTLKILFAVLGYGSALLVLPFIHYAAYVKVGIAIYAVAMFFLSLSGAFDVLFQARQQPRYPTLGDLTSRNIVFIGTLILYIFFRQNVPQIALFFLLVGLNVIGYLAMLLLKWYGAIRQIKLRLQFDWPYWRYLLVLSLPMGVLTILGQIHIKADAFLLTLLQSPQQVAIYNVAYKILDLLLIFYSLFGGIIFPALARYSQQDTSLYHQTTQRVINLSLALSVPITVSVAFFAPEIAEVISNGHYPQSALPLQILSLALIFIFMNMIYNYIVIVNNHQNQLIWVAVVTVAANIACNLYAIPRYSYIGSAIATDITEGLGMLLGILIVNRYHPSLPSIRGVLSVALATVVMIGSLLLLQHVIFPPPLSVWPSLIYSIPIGVLGLSIYALVLLLCGGVDPALIAFVKRRLPFVTP